MDFTILPPEINSARMYSGPGSGSILAAAAAWDQLAHAFNASAAAYRSVIATLTRDSWTGPSSIMVANAAAPYVAWLHDTAAQAEQTAAQAKAATAAYDLAFGAIVPPAEIAANRTLLLTLIATNFFGQNSPAIATAEAHYEAMWARDISVMHAYHTASATASQLTPFTDPPRTTNPAAAAAAQGVAATQSLGSPAQAAPPAPFTPTDLFNDAVSSTSGAASVSSSSFGGASVGTTNHAIAINAERDEFQGIGPFLAGAAEPSSVPVSPAAGLATAVRPPVSAVMGRAGIAGALSVPQAWAATEVAGTPISTVGASAPAPLTGAAPPAPALPPGMFGEAMMGTLAGRGVSNAAAKARRPNVVPRSPAAG